MTEAAFPSAGPEWVPVHRVLLLLAEDCPACRERLERALTPERVASLVAGLRHGVTLEVRSAASTPRELADHLLGNPDSHRLLLASPQIEHEAVARELLDRSRHLLDSDPGQAERAAALALDALAASPAPPPQPLRLAIGFHHANAVRLLDPRRAGALLDALEARIASCASRALRGDLHLLAALVRRAEDRFDDAAAHLERSLDAYERAGDPQRAVHALLHAASLLRRTGDLAGAIRVLRYATTLADPDADREAYLSAHHNLAAYLIDESQYDEARDLLLRVLPLYPAGAESPVHLQYRWLSARLASATGDFRGALGTFEELRDRLLALDRPLDAAQVVLDLARFHLDLHEPQRAGEHLLSLRTIVARVPDPALQGTYERILAKVASGAPPARRQLNYLSTVLRRA